MELPSRLHSQLQLLTDLEKLFHQYFQHHYKFDFKLCKYLLSTHELARHQWHQKDPHHIYVSQEVRKFKVHQRALPDSIIKYLVKFKVVKEYQH